MSAPPLLSALERRVLLGAAREAIAAHLSGRTARLPQATGALAAAGGAFVSLHRRSDGELRGCIGQLRAEGPLLDAVVQMAVAAATQDERFAPVTLGELEGTSIEISALSGLEPIRPDAIEVGRHGLVVRAGDRRGVLLPQVPLDQGWERDRFLGQTCRKAGLAADAWKQPGTQLSAFTAAVFSDED